MDTARADEDLIDPPRRPPSDPLVGWRYWQLNESNGRLRSVSHRRIEWQPGRPLEAVCLIGGHPAPAGGCACGIYASRDLRTLLDHGLCFSPDIPLVVGRVSLWGTLTADDHGWRGQYAYPLHLSVVTEAEAEGGGGRSAAASLSSYGVPVDTVPPAQAMGEISAALLSFQGMSRPSAPRL